MTQQTQDAPTHMHESKGLLLLLILFQMIAPISIDMSLPAMPALAKQMTATQAQVQGTLSIFFLVFGCSQLIWGPVSDRFGRKAPLLIGALLYIVGSLGCALSSSINELLICRILQGAGAAAQMVLGSAIIRDVYSGAEEVRARSQILLVSIIGLFSAPILGGQITTFGNWRLVFWIQAAICLFVLFRIAAMQDSLPAHRRINLRVSGMALKYAHLFGNRRYVGAALSGSCVTAAMVAYNIGSPFIYIDYFHVEPQYFGWFSAVNILGMVLASFLSRRWVVAVGSEKLLLLGIGIGMTGGILFFVVAMTGWGGLPAVMLALFLCVSVIGFTTPNSIAMAMANFPENAGSAAAMCGALSQSIGGLGGGLLGYWADGTPVALGKVVVIFMAMGLLSNLLLLGLPRKFVR